MTNSTTKAELQPCPFCGCPAYKLFTYNKNQQIPKYIPTVRCTNVLCAVELVDSNDKTAIEKWNSRAVSVARSAVSSTSTKNETTCYSHGYRI